jgi:predicted Zn-dependent peptidase
MEKETPPSRRLLDNGTVLLSQSTPAAHGVSFGLWVRSGTRDEKLEQGGISHLLEHMVFKGTDRRTAFELARDMEELGGSLDAFTTKEMTAYTLRVLPQQLPEALSILSEMLERSVHPPDQLALEKEVVIDEILSSDDTPDDFVHERFMEHLLPGHPLSRPILGTPETVKAVTREGLLEHMRQVHRGSNVVLTAAGTITQQQVEEIGQAFHFPAGSRESGPVLVPPKPAPGVFSYPRELSQLYLEIGIPTVGVDHPDHLALVLLANLLGGGMSSRLFQRVREDEGLAYSIYSWAEFNADTGSLGTTLAATPGKSERALSVIAAEYEKLRRGELAEDEIVLNRNQVLASMILGLEGSMHQISRMARNEIYHGRFVSVEELITRLYAITRDDLVRLAQQYLDPALQTVVGHGAARELSFDGSGCASN